MDPREEGEVVMSGKKSPKEFTYTWAFEPFDRDPSFYQKKMFGGLAAYLDGRMVMVLVEDPGERSYREKSWDYDIWNGIMLPTEKAYQRSLMEEFKGLKPHPVLGKWLYLRGDDDDFETKARSLAECIAARDERIGIEPKVR